MRTEFYAYVTSKGATRITRRRGQQQKGEVMVRLVIDIPREAWQPEGVPSAEIKVPLEAVKKAPVELTIEALQEWAEKGQ